MRIRDLFPSRAPEEDRHLPRHTVAGEIATLLAQAGCQVHGLQRDQVGPLGGLSDCLIVAVDTPWGERKVRVAVYGWGVFADDLRT